MTNNRDINTGGGDYREINNRGQYAEGDIYNLASKPPDRTSNEPPNNLESRGIDRDRFVGRDAVLQDLHARLQRSERVRSRVWREWVAWGKASWRCSMGGGIWRKLIAAGWCGWRGNGRGLSC
ncbi:MAG: hypothetical protein HC795_12190 [Coleofasciculaceae cyanobacterium RL_1_1]|nr:hypothetical protein [Coleofasciculaceae cyanobacterium RL_1_1]